MNDSIEALGLSAAQIRSAGAQWTAREIAQQPQLWPQIARQVGADAALRAYLAPLLGNPQLRIVLTGAGTSAYIGKYPEQCHHLIVTCNAEGELSRCARGLRNVYPVVLPEACNDQSFAMTSSFTGMLLAAALALGALRADLSRLEAIAAVGGEILTTHVPQAAIGYLGDEHTSALYTIWRMAAMKARGIPPSEGEMFRLQGGNEQLPIAFARRLGSRVKLAHPITAIRQSDTGVTVSYREYGDEEDKSMDADFFVNCISLTVFRNIPLTPALSPAKQYVVDNLTYESHPFYVFEASSRRRWHLRSRQSRRDTRTAPRRSVSCPNISASDRVGCGGKGACRLTRT